MICWWITTESDVIKSKLGRVEKHVADREDKMTRHELIRNDLFVPPPTVIRRINWYLYTHYITMPDLSQAVPSKDLKQWHSPSSRSEAIDTLIHGVGTPSIENWGLELMCRPIQSRKSTYDGGLLEGTDGTGRTGFIGKPSCFEAVSWPPPTTQSWW